MLKIQPRAQRRDFAAANELGVRPEGVESAARKIDTNVDDAIEKDFKAV